VCDRCNKDYSANKIAAAERALLSTIFSNVTNYPYPFMYSYTDAGTPMIAKTHRELNCFTAPWLLATLLIKYGIQEDQIFFCATDAIYTEAGRHNGLLVVLADNTVVFVDPITNVYTESFQCAFFGEQKQQAAKFLTNDSGEHSFAAQCTILHGIDALPTAFHINRLQDGIAANYWLNMGNKLAEQIPNNQFAQRQQTLCAQVQLAYETGLAHVPTHAHLLHNLGIHLWKQGKHKAAKQHLHAATSQPINVPITHITLGDIACMEGDAKTATLHYQAFVDSRPQENKESKNAERALKLLNMDPKKMVTFVQIET
jgi:hypothetical protein